MSHPSNRISMESIEELFRYHDPKPGQTERYQNIRAAAKVLAVTILENCPDCADRSAALRQVREAMMTANASIALEEGGS